MRLLRRMQYAAPMTADEFRDIALSMPDAIEGAHMRHPDFRVNGRIFASIHSNDSRGMIKLGPEEQAALLREHRATFTPSAGAWGRQGCTDVLLGAADQRAVRTAMLLAWERTTALPPARTRKSAANSKRRPGAPKATAGTARRRSSAK